MKKLVLFILAAFTCGRAVAQSIPDGNFNTWNISKNWMDPAGYNTSNDQDFQQVPGFTPNVTQLPSWNLVNGNYAVQLVTEAVNGDTLPGYITNSINNPLQGIGGVPYSGQPNGIEVWYNYTSSTVSKDTGGMIVVFKKSGSIIGTYLCPLPPTSTNYPLQAFTFSPALPSAADTVIFASTSSINVLNGKNGFVGSTLAISEVEFTSGTSQPTDLNWNFSTWVGDTAFAPTGWSAVYPGVYRTTDAKSAPYALALQTTLYDLNNDGDSTQTSVATTGILTNSGIVGGQPYTLDSDKLEFYYKYTPSANNNADEGNVSLLFKKSGSYVYETGMNLTSASSYTHIEVPFMFGTAPDSVIVAFFSSATLVGSVPISDAGSTLEVDDVEFESQPLAGIKPVLLANNSILIYPNPASNQITVADAQNNINEVRLDNILGQTVLDKSYSQSIAALKENVDVSSLPSGVYFITVTSGNNASTGKILVNR